MSKYKVYYWHIGCDAQTIVRTAMTIGLYETLEQATKVYERESTGLFGHLFHIVELGTCLDCTPKKHEQDDIDGVRDTKQTPAPYMLEQLLMLIHIDNFPVAARLLYAQQHGVAIGLALQIAQELGGAESVSHLKDCIDCLDPMSTSVSLEMEDSKQYNSKDPIE